MEIRGDRVLIKKLMVADVYLMRKWGYHDTPLLEDYNFPVMNDDEIKIWYKIKTGKSSNNYFSIRNENGRLIGYMGIKNIKKIRKKSTLGLVLDPLQVNKGYGSEILEVFLYYYFTEMNMNKMELEVSSYNKIAYRVYEKIGFIEEKSYLTEFFNPYIDKNDPYLLAEKSSFVIKDEKIYNYVYRMTLTKERFFSLRQDPF